MPLKHTPHRLRPRTAAAAQRPPDARLDDLQHLPEAELAELASTLRAQALRGVLEARGQAHLCEAELRRRRGAGPAHDANHLDLRPLDARGARRPWWAFW